MTKATAKPSPVSDVDVLEPPSIDATARMYSSVFGNMARAQTGVLRFLSDRFDKDAQMFGQIAACRNPADVVQLQLQWGSDAAAGYVAETQRMLGLFGATDDELAQASRIPA